MGVYANSAKTERVGAYTGVSTYPGHYIIPMILPSIQLCI